MIETLNQKAINVTPPAAIKDNASFATTAVDTIGFGWVTFYISLGATDIALAALKLQESNDSGMSGATDVSGGDYSVSSTLPSANDDNKIFAIHVDCRGKKRYLDLVLTAGDGATGTFASVLAILGRPQISPSSATDRGLGGELIA